MKALKLFFSIGLAVFLLWWIQRDLTSEQLMQIKHSVFSVSWSMIALMIALAIIPVIIRAYRWRLLLHAMGYSPHIFHLIASIFIMYLANLAFPRLGEVLRCSILAKYADVPIEKSIGTMVVERTFDVLGLALIAGIAFILEYPKFISLFGSYFQFGTNLGLKLAFLAILGLVGLFFIRWLWASSHRFALKIKEIFLGFWQGVASIGNLQHKSLFLAYTLLIYVFYLASLWFFYQAFTETQNLSFSSLFLNFTAGTIGVGLTQGGLGAYQLLMSQSMALYGVDLTVALSFSWAIWFYQTITLIIGGAVSWIALSVMNRKTHG
ncbi:MAG: flippase-like domain-containing protein [Chitinophagales bacterium]|nr:flippase-like domain-containing protein [Chitinophagales bacterium]